ncbi:organic cation transporter protein [Trichonephila inaurata madagascariensis]|uniref:Organic cation transporter protein n=1 Tax=Trichonephila inaurata madagascariensis TaxID=2747483 RepID=A0A8X6YQT7_9ARAC|nr:organic cation transporter protein [Trichonephila inaurata madagascariensis]
MDFTKILEYLGHFGVFQAFVYALACIVQLFVGIHMLANVFLLGEPKHRCYVPNCDTNETQYLENFVHFAIPNITTEDGITLNPCERYEVFKGADYCEPHAFNINKTVACDNFMWDHSEYESTVVSDFNIVCKKSWNGAASSSVFMFGVLFGSAGFGVIADKFGRKNVMMSASLIMLISSIGTSFAPNFGFFSFLRFITAAAVSGLFQTGYILAVEYIGTSKRLICANIMQIVFAIGELILSLVAFFVRKWRVLELAISIPSAVLLIYYWLLPESVRWLISKGKHSKAKQTILKAAKWNNATIPEHLLRAAEYTNMEPEMDQRQQSVGPLSLVKTPQIRRWSINIFFNWIVNAMVYYGLSLSTGHLSGNVYGNFAILAAVEIPAVLLATWALYYCGRRYVLCSVMVFGGLACGGTVFVPQALAWVSVMLAVLGKSAIAASFAIIYIYSAEIYPTVLRSTGIGFSSMFARLGGMIAPIINELRKVYKPLPMIIFALASIMAGALALALPETHNRQLPENIEEAESFASSREAGFERLLHRPRNLPTIGSVKLSVIILHPTLWINGC